MIENLIHVLQEKFIYKAIFIMNNVKFHQVVEIKELIKNGDYEIMCLPPYSPFLNLIENMLIKYKKITKRGNPQSKSELI